MFHTTHKSVQSNEMAKEAMPLETMRRSRESRLVRSTSGLSLELSHVVHLLIT